PTSIAVWKPEALQRYSNTSFLPAVNLVPGVRMEERSPGSVRCAIRGSYLRSPFGVRNVKAYWNSLPFTDGGGNTYLNLLDFGSVGGLEIIKGPGGSLYGAGTGGVLLIQSPFSRDNKLDVSAVVGSYGLRRYNLAGEIHNTKTHFKIGYAHQKSTGYREQTGMQRDALHADVSFLLSSNHKLSATVL